MAFSTIVAGVDFSPESDHAVRQAIALSRRTGAKLVLVHVGVVPEMPENVPPSMASTAATYRNILLGRLDDDRKRLGDLRAQLSGQGVEVSVAVIDGFADTGLAEAASQLRADLIIVGTHGRTGLRRLVLGSVAEKTVRVAEVSVVVHRGEPVEGGYRRVLVGSDFSPLSERAVERALEVAAPGAEVQVVHGWQSPGPELGLDAAELASLLVGAREEMAAFHAEQRQKLLTTYAGADVDLRVEAIDAAPAAGLSDLAKDTKADLIVVGSHGRRGIRRLLLGSVAEATVRHAPCSVMVAR